jgi:hypothetical protein
MSEQDAALVTGAADSARECVNCGHAERFHHAPQSDESPCTGPEDGVPCPCKGFESV